MFYVLDENGNRQEGLTKEETLSILQQAINDGSLAGIEKDSAFVSKLKCCVDGGTFKMAFITEAKFNELKVNNQLDEETLYFITDDTTEAVLEETIEKFDNDLKAFEKTIENFNDKLNETEETIEEVENRIKEDENGILKYGDAIIPYKKILWSGSVQSDGETKATVTLSSPLNDGDLIEIEYIDYLGHYGFAKFRYDSSSSYQGYIHRVNVTSSAYAISSSQILYFSSSQNICVEQFNIFEKTSGGDFFNNKDITLKKIYKVIE